MSWNDENWREAARKYHAARGDRPTLVETGADRLALLRRLLDNNVSIERAWSKLNDPRDRPTPETTIKAILYCVRERGLAALKEPANIERLSRCDAAAREEINRRLAALLARQGASS